MTEARRGGHRDYQAQSQLVLGHRGESGGQDLRPGTWNRILKQAQITREQLKKMGRRRKGRGKGR